MELIFLGTPEFAVPTLERMVDAGHRVLAVFTQPDRPKGRGGKLNASPVKEAALRLGLTVHQPERIRHTDVVEQLRELQPKAMIVVGYGQIIPQKIIDIPPLGIINVHASLLPKYRGAAPIQWAVANGEIRSGVTTMRIDAGLDTGDILLKWQTEIGPEEDALELGRRLAVAGADLLVQTLRDNPTPIKQNPGEATYAPILKKEDGMIDWRWRAEKIFNRSRGFLPWPGAYSIFRRQIFHIWKSRIASDSPGESHSPSGAPGQIIPHRKRLLIACGEGTALEPLEVQIEGRKRMPAEAFLNGQHLRDDETLGVKVA
ncbi:MAG: methionyl-tRNA formyltransferase [Bryobacterales bacterium]|nr:methionyl-tRNA formyltransferase [Bryobacterales bacterium]